MSERLPLVLGFLALLTALWLGARFFDRWQRRRLGRLVAGRDRPTVLYFFTPDCHQCRRVQAPVLEALRRAVDGAVVVEAIDASRHPDLAARYGVLTVPTTVVVVGGAVRAVNRGPVGLATLRRQLGLAEPAAAPMAG